MTGSMYAGRRGARIYKRMSRPNFVPTPLAFQIFATKTLTIKRTRRPHGKLSYDGPEGKI